MGGWSLPKLLGFSEGGFTGFDVSLADVAGVVHKGEYVVPIGFCGNTPEMIAELERIRKRGFFEGGYTLGQGITVGSGYKGRGTFVKRNLTESNCGQHCQGPQIHLSL